MSRVKLSTRFGTCALTCGLSSRGMHLLLLCATWSGMWNEHGAIPKHVVDVLMPRVAQSKATQARVLAELTLPMWGEPLLAAQVGGFLINPRLLDFVRDGTDWDRSYTPEVIERDRRTCRYCGIECYEDLTIDHLFPRSRGGGDGIENLVVACRSCNSRKSDRTPEEAGMVLLPVPATGKGVVE
jgi:hypothetical protein